MGDAAPMDGEQGEIQGQANTLSPDAPGPCSADRTHLPMDLSLSCTPPCRVLYVDDVIERMSRSLFLKVSTMDLTERGDALCSLSGSS
jgi:hypothetical protein